jgi:hypothetical protein
MTIGETLLKISDYPFTYAVILLLLRINGIDPLSTDATPYLLAAGVGATVLAVADPIGRIVKGWLMLTEKHYVNKRLNYDKILKSWNDVRGAFHTNPIEKERDKIVSTVYFLFLLGFLMNAIHDDTFYSSHFGVLYKNDLNCNLHCSEDKTFYCIFAVSLIIAGFGAWNGAHIFGRARTVAIYLYCKNSPSVSSSSIQSISDFIKSGDWETAKSWKDKITAEYLQEEGQRKDREEKLRQHISNILSQFDAFKKKCDGDNTAILLNPSFTLNDYSSYRSIEEIFKEFSLYDSLIGHLYTNDNREIFDSFYNYVKLKSKMKQENEGWDKEKDDGINKILEGLSLRIGERRAGGVRGENNQFINIALIKKDLDRFLEFERTELLPVRQKDTTTLYQVRFFDSSTLDIPRDDVVAELYQSDAEKLTVELATLANKLTESMYYGETDREAISKIQDILKLKVDEMLISFSVLGDPLRGSCQYCRNERFFNNETINQHQKLLENFPKKELDKDTIKPRFRKHESKDAVKNP